ncbi:nitrilase-related carbon-nitrogen hydrolase [Streptomyces sp. NPDC060235]|uniref:nitrilase-related carbon-nitrogen hydrolase n=1 Tax=Streptomyces sp. NPDC060235 TaxID=3347080 RepID=UPI0036511313
MDLLCVPTALAEPFTVVPDTLVPARAVESQLYVAYANRTGTEGPYTFAGRSCLAAPDGTVPGHHGGGRGDDRGGVTRGDRLDQRVDGGLQGRQRVGLDVRGGQRPRALGVLGDRGHGRQRDGRHGRDGGDGGRRGDRSRRGDLGDGVLRGLAELRRLVGGKLAVVRLERGVDQGGDRGQDAAYVAQGLGLRQKRVRAGYGRRRMAVATRQVAVGGHGGRCGDPDQKRGTECGGRDAPCGQSTHGCSLRWCVGS